MALDALLFDIDGTLLDTNWAHVEAWQRAFASRGYKVETDRIAVEIGKGGDLLVSAVLGKRAEQKDGDALRHRSMEEFLEIAGKNKFKVFPGVEPLLRRLRDKGIRTALATSSKKKHLKAMLDSAGIDLGALVDQVVTADDIRQSKPAPDAVLAGLAKLQVFPAQCAMVGDTPYDAEASRHPGVVCLGVLSGGNAEPDLRRAGARAVWKDTGDLLAHLDDALEIASPGPAHLTRQAAEGLMREALGAAREALAQGDTPNGAVLARADGTVLARGQEAVEGTGNLLAHAPLLALNAGAAFRKSPDLVLAAVVEPCIMCLGAALEAGIDTVLFAVPGPEDQNSRHVIPPETGRLRMPRVIGGVVADEARTLFGSMDHI